MSKEGQIFQGVADIPAIPLGDAINHVVGVTPTLIQKPATVRGLMVLSVEAGSFRIQLGDTTATLTFTPPATTDATGGGSLLITPAMGLLPYPTISNLTVVGADAGSILTWYVFGNPVV